MVDRTSRSLSARSEAHAEGFRRWLVVERGLAPTTVSYYVAAARLFLSDCGRRDLESLTLPDVTSFMVRHAPRFSVGTAKNLACGLRSFLGYLLVEGLVERQLALAVPAPTGPHGGGLPRALAAAQLAAVLGDGGGGTVIARRDHAMVVLLARLGLRAGEVAAMGLDDLDWGAGEIVIHGKANRTERLPMPVDVGEALVAYLHGGRPSSESRALFLRVLAPFGGLGAAGVRAAVGRACARAGVPPVGAHRLRHSAATAMLRAGASLEEIGQVLRQRSTQVTSIYAKVDFIALRALAMPWPGDAA